MDSPFQFLLRNASAGDLHNLLAPDADHVRLHQHLPSPEWTWWSAEVPLARNGKRRHVQLRALEFDLELPTHDFISWLVDFEAGGMSLIQTEQLLPGDLHPSKFRTKHTYLEVLAKFGARLEFQLPHSNETAGVTLFRQADVDRIKQKGIPLVEALDN